MPKAPAIKNGNTERALGDFHTGSSPVLTTKIKVMKTIYESPIGLFVEKYDWDDQFTITGKVLKSMTMKEFDSAYDVEEFIQAKINCKGISFDSEYCQFFAYAKNKNRAMTFIKEIEDYFAKVREMLSAK